MSNIISYKDVTLLKEGCCCGATKSSPCVCMVIGSDCSSKNPKCLCFKLLDKQQKLNKNKKKRTKKRK
jgi:hypothetical protein